MTALVTANQFSYRGMDGSTAQRLRAHGVAIRAAGQRMAEDAVAIGRHLIAAKKQVRPGEWQTWCELELGWALRTCEEFMRLAECFSGLECLPNFQADALRRLSNGMVAGTAVDEAVDLARSGQLVTGTIARQLIAKHAPASQIDVDAEADRIVGIIRRALRRAKSRRRELADAISVALADE